MTQFEEDGRALAFEAMAAALERRVAYLKRKEIHERNERIRKYERHWRNRLHLWLTMKVDKIQLPMSEQLTDDFLKSEGLDPDEVGQRGAAIARTALRLAKLTMLIEQIIPWTRGQANDKVRLWGIRAQELLDAD